MPNRHRGEIAAEFGGARYTLCLTLGALAELEAAFDADDLVGLAARFQSGRLSARDAIKILGAGLRGGGHDLSDEEVARLPCAEGAAGYVRILGELLSATFSGPAEAPSPVRPEGGPENPTRRGG